MRRHMRTLGGIGLVALPVGGLIWWGAFQSSPAVPVQRVVLRDDATLERLAQDPEVRIMKDLSGGDPARRQQAREDLRQILQTTPRQVAAELDKWIKPLSEAGLHEQVLALTDQALPLQPWNTSLVSDQQEARVKALLALGRDEQALSEAKSAFNVAPQKTAHRAADLLAEAMNRSAHPQSESDGFTAITVPPDRYRAALARYAGDNGYDGRMAQGNLLLLADRSEEAMAAFIQAIQLPGVRGKRLFAALEGVARSRRASSGSLHAGNAMIEAMKFGAIDSPALANLAGLELRIEDLQAAGRNLPLAEQPESFARVFASTEASAAAISLAGRMERPMAVVRQADPTDPALLNWLERFNEGQPISAEAREEAIQLLDKTALDVLTLFELSRAVHLATGDTLTSSHFYAAAAQRSHAILQAEGASELGLAILHAMLEYREDYKNVLWDRIDGQSDQTALNALHTLYYDFVTWCPEQNVELSSSLPSVQKGLAECLYLKGDTKAALAVLDEIDPHRMNRGERLALAWARGLVLFQDEQYEAAIVELKKVANDPHSKYAENAAGIARRAAVLEIAKTSRNREEAVARLQNYVEEQQLSRLDAKKMELLLLKDGIHDKTSLNGE